jgi:hypothetical protein
MYRNSPRAEHDHKQSIREPKETISSALFKYGEWRAGVYVGFVVDNVPLGQVFLRVLRFYPVNFIPPVLHYLEKWKKLTFLFIFITRLYNKP